jgi:hypothetical protein
MSKKKNISLKIDDVQLNVPVPAGTFDLGVQPPATQTPR